jgi:hypothetical protein
MPASANPSATRGAGLVESRAQRRIDRCIRAPLHQRAGRIAERAAHPHLVAHARTFAPQRLARRHEPMHGHAHGQGSARRIAADQLRRHAPRQREEAIEERIDPRASPCGIDSDKVHHAGVAPIAARSERFTASAFPADVGRRGAVGEMHADVQRVGGDHQLLAGRHGHHRRIVSDAQHHVVPGARRARADARDQVEFAGGAAHLCAASNSARRQAAAAWSSTPFT